MPSVKLTNWQLTAHHPYTALHYGLLTGSDMFSNIFPPVKAAVPGSIYKDLTEAGIIADPYYDMNSLLCEWVPQRWWLYKTDIFIKKNEKNKKNRHYMLRLNGIDYKAYISFNGKMLTDEPHTGMFLPYQADITELVQLNGENQVAVLLENAPEEMGQIGYTSKTSTQKPRCNYNWGFAARLVDIGLYGEAEIIDYGPAAIQYANITTRKTRSDFMLTADIELRAFTDAKISADFTLSKDGEYIAHTEINAKLIQGENSIKAEIFVENPFLWNVNGAGEQNLYDLEVTIRDNAGEISDGKNYKVGFRTLEYTRCDGAPENALMYVPVLNGKRVYINGVNFVPSDLMYGTITRERLEKLLTQAKTHNINLIRVWGGGVIESFDFYDLCDRCGIMVWQEFIQSSSGIDNIPSKCPEFLELLAKTSAEAVKVKRNHVSLTFWSGGNELTDAQGKPITYADENIAMLKALCDELNPSVLMLPSSASGPSEYISFDNPENNHDVHGYWIYHGPTEHYRLYNKAASMLHSEFSCGSMTNHDKFERFLSEEHRKVFAVPDNPVWKHHAEWWDMVKVNAPVFGHFEKDELLTLNKVSQVMQGDGVRYILDTNRRNQFKNTGSIIWQFNEPWPNIAGSSLVDYWGDAKYVLKLAGEAFRPRNVSLRHNGIVYEKNEVFSGEVFVVNNLGELRGNVRITIISDESEVLYCDCVEAECDEESAAMVKQIDFVFGSSPCYYVNLVLNDGIQDITSQYFYLIKNKDGFCDKKPLVKIYDKWGAVNHG